MNPHQAGATEKGASYKSRDQAVGALFMLMKKDYHPLRMFKRSCRGFQGLVNWDLKARNKKISSPKNLLENNG
jgi:hypothetical protein